VLDPPGRVGLARERVLVVRLPAHAARQTAGLETRLSQAENKLAALTHCCQDLVGA
jgi:hypothetical protein